MTVFVVTTTDAGKTANGFAVLAANPATGAATLIRVENNTLFDVPGYSRTTLREAFAFGGFAAARVAVANVLGVPLGSHVYLTSNPDRLALDLAKLLVSPARSNVAPEELRGLSGWLSQRRLAEVDLPSLPVSTENGLRRQPDTKQAAGLIAGLLGEEMVKRPAVALLNGNGMPGVGLALAQRLVEDGFYVAATGNAKDDEGRDDFAHRVSEIRAYNKNATLVARVHRAVEMGRIVVQPEGEVSIADFVVILGADYVQSMPGSRQLHPDRLNATGAVERLAEPEMQD